MEKFVEALTPAFILAVVVLALLIFGFIYYWRSMRATRLDGGAARSPAPRFSFPRTHHPLARKDVIPMVLVTVVYALTAFWNLGSVTNPQSQEDFADSVVREITFSEEIRLCALMYYPGMGTGSYCLEVSSDGVDWLDLTLNEENGSTYFWEDATRTGRYDLPQGYTTLFKWLVIEPNEPVTVRYMRITGWPDKTVLRLGELALYTQGEDGAQVLLPINTGGVTATGADALFDEQDTVPDAPSWYNSSYFDEIYHPRTALEHIEGIYPYEISHPPLGKLIIGLGIRMFGMTPFGWRFMGALFGVGMVPLLYIFLKNLFGKTPLAFCGAALFAFDFMHLTQTRIATIDTYAVFFILLMYYFMYRYLTLPKDATVRKGAPFLFLSGLFWGIGIASKWTVVYAGIGLAVLYLVGLWQRVRERPQGEGDQFRDWLVKTLLFSVLCFVVIPAVIYTLSYIPYLVEGGPVASDGKSPLQHLIAVMLQNQESMFHYHKGVMADHPYQSNWYAWLVDARPILYYLDSSSTPGMKTAFAAFSNPVVTWGGLLAMVGTVIQGIRRRSGRALFIVVGYLSQLAPWFFIGRTTFAYHYFPSILFLVLGMCYLFHTLMERKNACWKPLLYGTTGGAVALFALFYPVLVGIAIPTWYSTNLLKWFPSWPF